MRLSSPTVLIAGASKGIGRALALGCTREGADRIDDPACREVWGSVLPLGRTGETEKMVGPAVFLASADSSYVTGQAIYADGGWAVPGRIPDASMERAARKNR